MSKNDSWKAGMKAVLDDLKDNLQDIEDLKRRDVDVEDWDEELAKKQARREQQKEEAEKIELLRSDGTYDPTQDRKQSAFSTPAPDALFANSEIRSEISMIDELMANSKGDDDESFDDVDFAPEEKTPESTSPHNGEQGGNNSGNQPPNTPPPAAPQAASPIPTATPSSPLPVDEAEETFAPKENEKKPTPESQETESGEPNKISLFLTEALQNKKILGFTAIIVITILIIIFILSGAFSSSSEEPPAPPQDPASNSAAPGSGFGEDADFAEAPAPSKRSIIEPASKEAKCEGGVSTDISLAFDGDTNTAWICQRSLGIDGNTAHFTFDRPVVITDMRIIAGNAQITASGEDRWNAFRQVTRINVYVSGNPNVYTLNGDKGGDMIALTNPTATTDITIVIQQTQGEPQAEDAFAVSTIEFHGHNAS